MLLPTKAAGTSELYWEPPRKRSERAAQHRSLRGEGLQKSILQLLASEISRRGRARGRRYSARMLTIRRIRHVFGHGDEPKWLRKLSSVGLRSRSEIARPVLWGFRPHDTKQLPLNSQRHRRTQWFSDCRLRRITELVLASAERDEQSMTYRHVTAPTQFVEASGIRFAYRRFGLEVGTPLLFMQHFRGGMDHWDPAVIDRFAANRPVILFNNAGVASSSGETPDTIDAMAEHAADFVGVLGLSKIDLLGFSIGGYIAQALAIKHPELIRRLILVGTGPRAGEPPQDPKYAEYGGLTDPKTGQSPLEAFLHLFFSPSDTSSISRQSVLGETARTHARR